MDVQAAVARCLQDRNRKQQSISRHDRGIEVKRRESRLFLRFAQGEGGPNLDAQGLCPRLHRRWPQGLAPAGRTRRLAVGGNDMVPGGDQRLKRRDGEFRSSHEGDAHD